MASRTVLVGRVVDQHTGGNVVGATVSWQNGGASGDYIVEDSSGFVLPLAAGPAVVRVALIGFRVSEDTLWLGPRDSIEVTFPLDAIALDGCGFGVVVKRKAWWHFW